MPREPRVERRLRLLDERDPRQSGELRGVEGQGPRRFVERRGDRQDDVLRFERIVGPRVVPRGANMRQVEGADLDGRPFFPQFVGVAGAARGVPRQDRRGPVDSVVTEPRLCGRDVRVMLGRSVVTRQRPDGPEFAVFWVRRAASFQGEIAPFFALVPVHWGGVVHPCEKGGQDVARFEDIRRDGLRDEERFRKDGSADPRRFFQVDVGRGAIGRAQVVPDDVTNLRRFFFGAHKIFLAGSKRTAARAEPPLASFIMQRYDFFGYLINLTTAYPKGGSSARIDSSSTSTSPSVSRTSVAQYSSGSA